ncbi:dynamin family protein [Heliomicrobium undosum]|uniref:dynamin family protein n=1 Tax=Heliomicrobium undosum TaxID=121734 RepID=UPI001A9B33FC|nr:dynamin family protein [Heliomicrobium undosum]
MTTNSLPASAVIPVLIERLENLAGRFRQSHDEHAAYAAEALISKLRRRQLRIAFCGHVSGGKSALINALIGDDILPTSPIPSSANIVTVRSGPASARARLKSGDTVELDLFANLSGVQDHCLDSADTHSVDIAVPIDLFGSAVDLVDTPGVDSAETARRLAEDPAIVAADVIFYVMDYNHVQSEINFSFTKRLKERGKPVFLIVNQIDKHCDFELDFDYFRRSSAAGFAAWDIRPEGLFFTSLTDGAHPENELPRLKARLQDLFRHEEELLVASVLPAARQLIDDHCRRLADAYREERQRLQALLDAAEDLEEALRTYGQVSRQVDELRRAPHRLQEELDQEIRRIVENARITPHTTSELSRRYLESRSPGFKVGFLFSGEKTKKEIAARLDAVYADFRQHVSTQLEWHLRDVLSRVAESHGVTDGDYMQRANSLSVHWDADLLARVVREGAVAGNEYIHNYTRDIAAEVKSLYRREALALAEEAVQLAERATAQQREQLTRQLEPLQSLADAVKTLDRMDQEERKSRNELLAALQRGLPDPVPVESLLSPSPSSADSAAGATDGDSPTDATLSGKAGATAPDPLAGLGQALREQSAPARAAAAGVSALHPAAGSITSPALSDAEGATGTTADAPPVLQYTAQRLRRCAAAVAPLPGFDHIAEGLANRAERLDKNIFTVALFGAFSAGKSSVANALLGRPVLPVSPNPTTAAINKILPPNEENPHGTVRVRLKTAADIESDVLHSLSACDMAASNMAEALRRLNEISPGDIHPTAKPHYSFLRAVARGIGAVEGSLGEELVIDLDAFHDYVASEEKACFVEWIELYYQCPLTARGVMLVDTPGADSINARHTGVAFDYIKNADAILFVTYFNSAFSHADRDFLFQLGRVKDSFGLDKMFFLINAADLARSAGELAEVQRHVTERIAACGIRNPRLYTVSSQTALLARLGELGMLTASQEKTYRQRTDSLGLVREGGSGGVEISGAEIDSAGKAVGAGAAGSVASEGLLPWPAGFSLSGYDRFEADFYGFTLHELTQIAVSAAEGDMDRCLAGLDDMIEAAHLDASARRRKRAACETSRLDAERAVSAVSVDADRDLLDKEADELIYYVNQRIFYRFGDLFDRYFNPSVLQDSRGNITKKGMQHCLEELLQTLEKELAQEIRATSLRLEQFVHKRASQYRNKLAQSVGAVDSRCVLPAYEPATLPALEIPERLSLSRSAALRVLPNGISNPKDFFEGSGRNRLRSQLEESLRSPVQAYLSDASVVVKDIYAPLLAQTLEQGRHRAQQAVDDHYAGLLAALDVDFDVAAAERIRAELAMMERSL